MKEKVFVKVEAIGLGTTKTGKEYWIINPFEITEFECNPSRELTGWLCTLNTDRDGSKAFLESVVDIDGIYKFGYRRPVIIDAFEEIEKFLSPVYIFVWTGDVTEVPDEDEMTNAEYDNEGNLINVDPNSEEAYDYDQSELMRYQGNTDYAGMVKDE